MKVLVDRTAHILHNMCNELSSSYQAHELAPLVQFLGAVVSLRHDDSQLVGAIYDYARNTSEWLTGMCAKKNLGSLCLVFESLLIDIAIKAGANSREAYEVFGLDYDQVHDDQPSQLEYAPEETVAAINVLVQDLNEQWRQIEQRLLSGYKPVQLA